jgi:hypothetical protein
MATDLADQDPALLGRAGLPVGEGCSRRDIRPKPPLYEYTPIAERSGFRYIALTIALVPRPRGTRAIVAASTIMGGST